MISVKGHSAQMVIDLPFEINFMFDGSSLVITRDGEIIGSWDTDESDAIYQFTPNGAEAYLLQSPFMGELSKMVQQWLADQSDGST